MVSLLSVGPSSGFSWARIAISQLNNEHTRSQNKYNSQSFEMTGIPHITSHMNRALTHTPYVSVTDQLC